MMEPQPPTNVVGEEGKNKAEPQVENKSELDHGATHVVSLDDDVPNPKPFPEAEKFAQKPNGVDHKEESKIDSNNDNTNVASAAAADDDDEKSQPPLATTTATATANSGPSTPSKAKKSVHWSEELVTKSRSPDSSSSFAAGMGSAFDDEYESHNPYVARSPAPPNSFNLKNTVNNVRDVLGRWGKMVGEATRKAEDLAGNTWQHLKTSPSLADAALGRITQGTKILAEGGSENIFRQTFETVPEEQLQNSYACYLSTSAGPIMGVLYVSTAKLAFCSDNPLSYKADDRTEWSYYKVVIPLHQLKAVNPSSSKTNSFEKYIQIISVDNHEFWYMGFLNYEGAVKCLQEALQANNV